MCLPAPEEALLGLSPAGNHVRVMGDQASERFEKKWQMSAIEYHWDAHVKQCQLEDAVRLPPPYCRALPAVPPAAACLAWCRCPCPALLSAACLPGGPRLGRLSVSGSSREPQHTRRQSLLAAPLCLGILLTRPGKPALALLLQAAEAESKSLPDKLQEVTAELQELTRKVRARSSQRAQRACRQPMMPGARSGLQAVARAV